MKYLNYFDNSADVYVIGADDFIKPKSMDLDDYISVLSPEEKDRFNRYKNEKAKFTFLTARYYLRSLLLEKLKEKELWISTPLSEARNDISYKLKTENGKRKDKNEASELTIETIPSGKPYLKDYPNLFFNLSHTDSLILIALADFPVGVDVERLERNADNEAILKHFFSEKEQQSYFSQPENQRQLAFFKGWTRKEAILKATGEGLSAMKKFEVSFDPETDTPIIDSLSENNFEVKDFTPKDGYAACLVILHN